MDRIEFVASNQDSFYLIWGYFSLHGRELSIKRALTAVLYPNGKDLDQEAIEYLGRWCRIYRYNAHGDLQP